MSRFDPKKHFTTIVGIDIAGMLLGEKIGSGQFRDVYAHATNPDYVVKVENGARSFHNVAEYDLWKAVEDKPIAKWFAPVSHISPAGSVLVMRRVEHLPKQFLPKQVPDFFTDLKVDNWGLFEGRPVCCDYGLTLLLDRMTSSGRMKRATW